MSKGRQAPKTHTITLNSTGITLEYRKVSQYVVDDIRRGRKKGEPKPPLEEVETADGKLSQLPNPDNPEYSETLKAYNDETDLLIMNAFINLGVILDTEDEGVKADIETERQRLAENGIVPSTDNPKLFYVQYIACIGDEIGDLGNAIAQRSGPTPDAIEAAKSIV